MDITSYTLSKKYADQRVAELTGLDFTDVNSKLTDLLSISKTKSWTSTSGQLVYALGETYLTGQITLYIGGVPQISGLNFSETTSSSITLLCDPSEIPDGTNVVAVYK